MTYVFVDVEAVGQSPVNGTMAEFAAITFPEGKVFHGKIWKSRPNADNPAIPDLICKLRPLGDVMAELEEFLKENCDGRPVFFSDNPAYDFMWIAGAFDWAGIPNPFGHSGRRIGDLYAGRVGKINQTSAWKKWRVTTHDHNPVNDVLGNIEAFRKVLELFEGTHEVTEHVPDAVRVHKMDGGDFWSGSCSCGAQMNGIGSKARALKDAQQHADAKNKETS